MCDWQRPSGLFRPLSGLFRFGAIRTDAFNSKLTITSRPNYWFPRFLGSRVPAFPCSRAPAFPVVLCPRVALCSLCSLCPRGPIPVPCIPWPTRSCVGVCPPGKHNCDPVFPWALLFLWPVPPPRSASPCPVVRVALCLWFLAPGVPVPQRFLRSCVPVLPCSCAPRSPVSQ